MKVRKAMATVMAGAMVGSAVVTAVSAADIQWTDIIGLNAEKTSEYHIVNNKGQVMTDDNRILKPNTEYYVVLGTSDIYQNYMNYERLVKIGVKTVTGGDKLVSGSVKLAEKYFENHPEGANRYTVITFKTIQDMTDSELNLYFNVELTARDDLSMKIGVDSFPIVTGTKNTSTTVSGSNTANTQVLARANEAYRLVSDMAAGIPVVHNARVALMNSMSNAVNSAEVPTNPTENDIYVGSDSATLNKGTNWYKDATSDSGKALANDIVSKAEALYAATVNYVNSYKDRMSTVASYTDLATALGTDSGALASNIMKRLFDNYGSASNPTTGSLAGVTLAGPGSTLAVYNVALNDLYTAATSGVMSAAGYLNAYQTALSRWVDSTNNMVGQNYVQGANYLNQGDTLVVPVKVWFKNAIVDGPDTDLTAGTGGQWYTVQSNEWNELIWEDGNNEIARLYFHADSNSRGFYTQLKTTWSNEWYRQYFAHADAYKFEFVGTPTLSTSHRATLAMYMPFLDSNGLSYVSDPTDVYIYRINEADGTIEDMTEYFSYTVDSNGKGWYEADTRALSTYVISAVPANLPVENVEIVPDTTIVVPTDTKLPANTGR